MNRNAWLPLPVSLTVALTVVLSALVATPAAAGSPVAARTSAGAGQAPAALAAGAADALVAGRPGALHASPGDAFTRRPVLTGPGGLRYVPYERSHRGLPVVGGDFVVVTDAGGRVLSTSVGQQRPISLPTTNGRLGIARAAARAAAVARGRGVGGTAVASTRLIVLADGPRPELAYESVVTGNRGAVPSRLHVFVAAGSGKALRSYDEVAEGQGNGAINGPNPLPISTSGSGTSFSMADPTRPGVSCRNYVGGAVLTGADDVWGDGNGTNLETGCVDALFSVQREWDMLAGWLGRDGINGSGGGFPVRVGLDDQNAYWDGTKVVIGKNVAGAWISSLDVVGHEFGHAVDSTTPGGASGNGVSEATGDIFGALSEAWAGESAVYDPPDYLVGEEIDLVGGGPIRNMANPGALGDPGCYSASIPTTETHAAAGPFNHWFYLVAQGSNPTNGNPISPTCNGSTVTGALGIQTAGRIFYSAMLTKTANMSYLKYRTATLEAAKNLFPGDCAPFTTVKAAWDAVSVPAQTADPTCTLAGPPLVTNPGDRSTVAGTAVSLQLTASGGTPPYTWSAAGLPPGLSIDASSGLISGTVTTVGSFPVTVTAIGGGGGSATFTWAVTAVPTCSAPGQKLANPGFENTGGWTATDNVFYPGRASRPARSGSWLAYLDGYGIAHADTLTQTVAIPAGCTVTLSFAYRIITAETTTTTPFDRLTVKVGGTTVATYSNLDANAAYALASLDVSAFAGSTVTVSFTGVEDTAAQTSFLVDDAALTAE
ncbi:MAG TPA: M4 family metallopeptidase [Dermatophilaceae bacterium]|nr:M4 family metallopeptidase [Dermatophilaceae bacterium]